MLAAVRRLFGSRVARAEWLHARHERRAVLEKLFGAAEDLGPRPSVPFELGGDAELLLFPQHIVGARLYVTADLTTTQPYELALCVRGDETWPPSAIRRLAAYCAKQRMHPGDTVRLKSAVPQPSAITGFVFDDYGTFALQQRRCGVLMAVGITADELRMSAALGTTALLEELRGAGVFPFTDLERETITGDAA